MPTPPASASHRGAFLDVQPDLLTSRLSVMGDASSTGADAELDALTLPAEAAAAAARRAELPHEILPQPTVCCKTRDSDGNKVFVNVCTSDELPVPPQLTEERLREQLQHEDTAQHFRIPMSLGEAHKELDKSGSQCTAYDVVIHPQFYAQVDSSLLFKTFFVTVMIEAIEQKFDVQLDKNQWVTMRNKLYLGKMPKHFIRRRDMPKVQECSHADTAAAAARRQPLISEVESKRTAAAADGVTTPTHHVERRRGGRLVVSLQLPAGVTSARQLALEVSDARLVVSSESARLLADVPLPEPVCADSARAAYSRASGRLAVVLACLAEQPAAA